MSLFDKAFQGPERRDPIGDEPPRPSPVVDLGWDIVWGVVALSLVSLWISSRTDELDREVRRAQLAIAHAPPALTRLSTPELVARRQWTSDLAVAYRRLVDPVSWPRVLAHLARAIPAGDSIARLQVAAPWPDGGTPSVVVTLTTSRSARLAAAVRAEPYLAQVLPRVQVVAPANAAGTVELSGPGLAEGAP